MKKKWFSILIVLCVVLIVVTACGSTGNSDGGDTDTATSVEIYDVGAFTVAVPSGWKAFPQDDFMGEKDEDGNYPPDPDQIVLGKGVKDQYTASTGPMVQIIFYEPDEFIGELRNWYQDVTDIEGVTVNGVACDAFFGNSMGMGDIRQEILYVTDEGSYEFIIQTEVDGKETGISWDDPDVMEIMGSVISHS